MIPLAVLTMMRQFRRPVTWTVPQRCPCWPSTAWIATPTSECWAFLVRLQTIFVLLPVEHVQTAMVITRQALVIVMLSFENALSTTEQDALRDAYCTVVATQLQIDVTCSIEQTSGRRLLSVDYVLSASA